MNSNDATVTVPNPYKFANGGSPNIAPTRTYGNYTGGSPPPRQAAPLVSEGTAGPAYHPADLDQIPSYHPPQHQSMQAPSPSSFHARPGRGAGAGGAGEGTAAAAGEEGAAMLGAGEAAGGLETAGIIGGVL